MSDTLDQPWMKEPYLTHVIHALGQENVRFVGGCVRDALMHRTLGDVDMATSLLPQAVIERLEKQGIKAIPTGIDHGTITAVSKGIPIEITTLRSDTACDGRHASVTFTDSWKEDAERRDFTINALSCDVNGKIYDYTGGMHDLVARRLRFIGDARKRCQEDYLRILRYFRFYASLAIEKIDDTALSACEREAKGIDTLSGERIQNEMLRLLSALSPLRALKMMENSGVLEKVMLSPVKVDIIAALEATEPAAGEITERAITRLAALCRGANFNKDAVDKLIARWKLSNHDRDTLLTFCFPPKSIKPSLNDHEQRKLIRAYGKNMYQSLVILAWAQEVQEEPDERYLELLELSHTWKIPTFPLHGKDLIAIGIQPGKEMGTLLHKAEIYWENNNYSLNKKDLLEWVKKH